MRSKHVLSLRDQTFITGQGGGIASFSEARYRDSSAVMYKQRTRGTGIWTKPTSPAGLMQSADGQKRGYPAAVMYCTRRPHKRNR